jgi:hypothetical protein
MHVSLDEAGQHGLPLEIDDLGDAADIIGLRARLVAHIKEFVPPDGHGGGVRVVVVHGIDVAVYIHALSGLSGGKGRDHACQHGQRQHYGQHASKSFSCHLCWFLP